MVTDLIRKNVIQAVLIGLVLIVVVTLVMIGSVKKSLKPMESMKLFIRDKVIGRENCKKQKNEVQEIQYLIGELEEKFIGVIRQTREEADSVHTINGILGDINRAQAELSDAVAGVNKNLQEITYSSENMSAETKGVLQSIGKLQENMQQFRV